MLKKYIDKNFAMEYSFLSLFVLFAFYVLLFYVRRSLERQPSHSFTLRIAIGIVGWCMTLSGVVYVLSMAAMAMEFFAGDPGAGFGIILQLIILVIVVRLYVYYEDSMDLGEMRNFFRDALAFRNYLRKKDYEIREELERHEVRRIYRETTNKELTAEVTATAFDYYSPPLSKDRTPVKRIAEKIHSGHAQKLTSGARVDATEVFHLELMGNKAHPYLLLIHDLFVDGKAFTLSFSIVLPLHQHINRDEPNAKDRIIERLYGLIVILTSLQWFRIYEPFARMLHVRLFRTELNESAHEEKREVARLEIPLSKLRARGTKITPASEVEKIASIHFNKER